jgi:DNA gyrase/topoisomerase IV subunit B
MKQNHIKVLSDFEHCQKRTGMYLGQVDDISKSDFYITEKGIEYTERKPNMIQKVFAHKKG